MIIQHNMNAIAAERSLSESKKQLHTSTSRLSSGYRVNSSADDAAALKISEKMRWQIRGMNRASDNIGEGMELVKVAESALQEVHDMLQRLVELTIQAANDTNQAEDRDAIQQEINQIKSEINRISVDTEYNKIKIFEPPFRTKVRSQPSDILVYHEDCASDPRGWREGGIVYNGRRYSYESMGIQADGDIPEGTYQAHVLAQDGTPLTIDLIFDGDSRIPSGRKYVPQADADGIRIDHILHPWNTIKNEYGEPLNPNAVKKGTYSFEHAGITFSFDLEDGMSQTSLIKWVQEDLAKTYDFRTEGVTIEEVAVNPDLEITERLDVTPQKAPWIPGNTSSNNSFYQMEADENGIRLVVSEGQSMTDAKQTFKEWTWKELGLDEWTEGESVNPGSTVTGGEKLDFYQYVDLEKTQIVIDFTVDSEVSRQELINAINSWSISVKTECSMKINQTGGTTDIPITPNINSTIPSLDAYGTQFDMGLCQVERPVELAKDTPIVDSSGKLTFAMQSPNQNFQFTSNTTLNDLKEQVKDDLMDFVTRYGSCLEYNLNHSYQIPVPSGEYNKSVLFTADSGGFKMSFDYPQNFTGWLTDQMFIQTPTTPDPDPVTGKFQYKVTFDETGFGAALEQRAEELADRIVKSFSDSRYTIETSGDIKANMVATPIKTTENARYSSLVTTKYKGLKIQTSSKEGDHITIPLTGMDTEILGIDDIKVSNYDEASASIKKIHRAVNIVSGIRSDFGAIHNRMSAAMMVDDVLAENTQAAESQIRDTDMSFQSVEQSKYRILGQMKEAVLAQANHTKDGVAVLLQ